MSKADDSSDTVDYWSKIQELDTIIEENCVKFNTEQATEMERQDYFRKRNALYSQRKYYKKKLKIGQLLDEKKVLEDKNVALKAENDTLEKYLFWAQEQVKNHEQIEQQKVASSVLPQTSCENDLASQLLSVLGLFSSAGVTNPVQESSFSSILPGPTGQNHGRGVGLSENSTANLLNALSCLLSDVSGKQQRTDTMFGFQASEESAQNDLLRRLLAADMGAPAAAPHMNNQSRIASNTAATPDALSLLESIVQLMDGNRTPSLNQNNPLLLLQAQQQQQQQQLGLTGRTHNTQIPVSANLTAPVVGYNNNNNNNADLISALCQEIQAMQAQLDRKPPAQPRVPQGTTQFTQQRVQTPNHQPAPSNQMAANEIGELLLALLFNQRQGMPPSS